MTPGSSVNSARAAPCVHAFEDSDRFGRELAACLKARFAPVKVHRFPDGESLVRVDSAPASRAILVRSLFDPNAKIVETLLAADALRRAGVRRTILVAPYLPYMRQDCVFTPGEPISQRVIGGCLGPAFDQLLTVDPHLHRVRRLGEVFPCRADRFRRQPPSRSICAPRAAPI
jgi:ribose-phosphate pyrophosphokinase